MAEKGVTKTAIGNTDCYLAIPPKGTNTVQRGRINQVLLET